MTLHILGAGSIGLLYASWMRNIAKEFPLCLLLQSHHANKIKNVTHGAATVGYITTKLIDIHGNTLTQKVPSEIITKVSGNSDGNDETGNCNSFIQNVLLTTKAPQAVHALESILPRFHPKEKVKLIVMTNGCLAVVDGIKDSLTKHNLEDRVDIICASTTHGAMRMRSSIPAEDEEGDGTKGHAHTKIDAETFQVVHTGLGHTFIENDDDHVNINCSSSDETMNSGSGSGSGASLQKTLNKIWNEVGLRSTTISHDEMYVMNWKKLAANCAINPLTALRNCRNGDLLSDTSGDVIRNEHGPESGSGSGSGLKSDGFDNQNDLDYTNPSIFHQLIQEVSTVALADAQKIRFKYDDDKQHQSKSSSAIHELEYDQLLPFVESVVRNTARNKSSMLQDILSTRYPTEIMYLNGYVARLGRHKYGIEVPANRYVTEEIERITTKCDVDVSAK